MMFAMSDAAISPQRRNRRFTAHGIPHMERLEGMPLASFRSRFFAFVVDMLLVICVFLAVSLFFMWRRGEWSGKGHVIVHFNFHEIECLIFVVLYFGLLTYFTQGRTLGKWLAHIRVVSLTHQRITLWQSIERALGYGASTLEAGFGFIQYFIHPNRCCVHDRIAETIVVRDHPSIKVPD
ncbi:MAG TPA: RDD family protein [Terriglobales bacterium]